MWGKPEDSNFSRKNQGRNSAAGVAQRVLAIPLVIEKSTAIAVAQCHAQGGITRVRIAEKRLLTLVCTFFAQFCVSLVFLLCRHC